MVEEVGAIVVGAGPSGLAVGACLRERRIPFVLLDQAEAVGASWRRHYDRLHLHTVKQLSGLPGMPWPENAPLYPSRAQMVSYLERYAERFQLGPCLSERVIRALRDGERWVVRTPGKTRRSRALVVATGFNRVPVAPSWPGQVRFGGRILHSAIYRSGASFRGQRVLVVGMGNSGSEIALDLFEHGARPTIAVRGPVHVMPRDYRSVPAQVQAAYVFRHLPLVLSDRLAAMIQRKALGDLSPHGLRVPEEGLATHVQKGGRAPLLDVGTAAMIKQRHIEVVPAPQAFTEAGVVFSDGRALRFDAVVLATGYRAGLSEFLDGAERYTDAGGRPRWQSAPAEAPGLFFVGYCKPRAGTLLDIAREAPQVAEHIAELLGAGRPGPRRARGGEAVGGRVSAV
ncbi:flavin-containing monooxygenase [Chondromyces crocatus]|uniref:Monooxygenase n=1 Tax=Chondromyces crocatus TaxID=52 RepID=A0A0K1ER27_CHOCO|nr:NAD(P)/FAD-dependent oxidoreductase [Chondromyces crocatus]AKT43097.1 monooxygenase [Chondromyces crocatus]